MTGSQSGPTRGADAASGPPRPIRSAAEPLVVAGLAAHGAVVGLTAFFAPPPLLTALVATLAFAGISLATDGGSARSSDRPRDGWRGPSWPTRSSL